MTEGAYDRSTVFSEQKLSSLRSDLASIVPEGTVALTCGSYARREASDQSDLDFFLIGEPDNGWLDRAKSAITALVPLDPAAGGAFGALLDSDSLVKNIGGTKDTNQTITRRMLFLLEGEWLTNESLFKKTREEVISKYVDCNIADHHVAKFLLNDIIRYWRTMAVDYEHKIDEQNEDCKPWGTRNIKLAFSRKLLYAGGLFAVGQTSDRSQDDKKRVLLDLFEVPALKRIETLVSAAKFDPIARSYDVFLEAMEDGETRNHLNTLAINDRTDGIYRMLKNEAHRFDHALLSAFEDAFHSTHPMRRAVIF